MIITSAYRTPAHNKASGGAAYSQHLYGRAADFKVAGVGPDTVAAYAETLLPDQGGIGVYPPKTGRVTGWVHVDTRPEKAGGGVRPMQFILEHFIELIFTALGRLLTAAYRSLAKRLQTVKPRAQPLKGCALGAARPALPGV